MEQGPHPPRWQGWQAMLEVIHRATSHVLQEDLHAVQLLRRPLRLLDHGNTCTHIPADRPGSRVISTQSVGGSTWQRDVYKDAEDTKGIVGFP